MRRLDGYLSRKAQTMFPKALVYCDESGPVEVWSLEWAGQPTIGLGNCFRAAKGAVETLIAAERAKSTLAHPLNIPARCPHCGAPDYKQNAEFTQLDWATAPQGKFLYQCTVCRRHWSYTLPAPPKSDAR